MSVIRIKHQRDYVVINKLALEDPNLSFKAKGLWAYCMSRPDDWEFHVSHLATVSKDGEDAIYSAIKELEREGYVKKVQGHHKGRFQPVDYEISEIKIILPLREKQDAVKQDAENPPLLSIDSHQTLKKNNPPLPPPPTKEEEEEISRRYKNRPKDYEPILSKSAWRAQVLEGLREERTLEDEGKNRIKRHRQEAEAADHAGKRTIRGELITAREDGVEFTTGSRWEKAFYDISDEEWERQASYLWKNGV